MDLTLNLFNMKLHICLFFALLLCCVSCKNANEPNINKPFDGNNVTLRVAPLSFGNSANNNARKIWGYYSSEDEEITFSWNSNDTIWVGALDDDEQVVDFVRFTVTDFEEETGIATFTGNLPQGSTQGYYKVAAGPTTLPKNQIYEQQGISKGMLRFENKKILIDESTDIIHLTPVWSALIFNPAYTYTIEPKYNKEQKMGLNPATVSAQIALKSLVVEISTVDSTYTMTYTNTDEELGEVITFSSDKGNVSTQPLILVVAPTQKCISIKATYNHDLTADEDFGTYGETSSKSYNKQLQHNLAETVVKTLNFPEDQQPAFEENIAYVLDPSTVTNITWTGILK